MSYACTECICRNGHDVFHQDKKPCEHWLRSNCPNDCCKNCKAGNYDIVTTCKDYKISSERIEPCLMATNQVFDDGTRICPLIDCYGCERCMKEWEKKNDE